MYFSTKIHILSTAIFLTAMVNTLAEIFRGGVRFLLRGAVSDTPDMLNAFYRNVGTLTVSLRTLLAIVIFFLTWKKLMYYKGLIDEDDMEEMGQLQREFLKDNKSTLTVLAMEQLVRVWGVILIGVVFIYDITSEVYTGFIAQLNALINQNDSASRELFVSMYNNTHGFKYIGMIIAILLGVVITGIFLRDKYLVVASLVGSILFLAAFVVFQMDTFVIFNRTVGIVWTSVIFHAIQTIGLLTFSLYIRCRYRGM